MGLKRNCALLSAKPEVLGGRASALGDMKGNDSSIEDDCELRSHASMQVFSLTATDQDWLPRGTTSASF